jgi:DNA-binding beta-propeller fold protein YncE
MKLKKINLALALTGAMSFGLVGCVDDGADGAVGPQGPQGEQGIQGPQGEQGSAGAAGQNASGQVIALERVGRTASQGFGVSAAEIVAYDKARDRIFVVNAQSGKIDVFNGLTAAQPNLHSSLELAQMLVTDGKATNVSEVGGANSIAVYGDLAAVAVQAEPKTDNGWVIFLNLSDLSFNHAVAVGALPDMVTFTPDGSKVLVANEGEPSLDYSIDPEGSVSVITMADFSVVHIDFTDFNEGSSRFSELDLTKIVLDGYSPNADQNFRATVAQSFEPEYITVSEDGSKAFVALQENNAIVVINLADNSIDKIFGLGFKDHSIPGNEMDAGDEDGPGGTAKVNIRNWPVKGIYMPDSIDSFTYNGKTYLVTANEGDSREDWLENVTNQASCEASGYYFRSGSCLDEVRVKHLVSRAGLTLGPDLTGLDTDDKLGRLKASYHTTRIMNGNSRTVGTDKSQPINTVYAYGARLTRIFHKFAPTLLAP